MPTILTHAVVGAALALLVPARCEDSAREPHGTPPPGRRGAVTGRRRRRLLAGVSAALAMLPDADVVGVELGVPWGSMWSHRGVSHSLTAAAVVGVATALGYSGSASRSRARLAAYFALVTASHGVLDALTNGGLGVAFLAPFRADRFFFPWRPIEVSPMGLAFFSGRGLAVLESEVRWVWLPVGAVLGATALVRRLGRARGSLPRTSASDRGT
jgi:inner membrane protein